MDTGANEVPSKRKYTFNPWSDEVLMYPKLSCLTNAFLAIALGLASASAWSQSAAPAEPAGTATLRGHISDPTGALIPGVQVTLTTATGTPVKSATADAAGGYVLRGLAAGSYIVQSTFTGFATFVSAPIEMAAGEVKNLDIRMTIEGTQQQVEVSAEGGPAVSTEAGSNANAVVLKGADLDALSDDPDELSNELQALAGPSAGPNGGQIYIDGFTGGELPPKSAIREIRINQNPFSAEFDRLGYGRIEILTKPGTDKLHGRVFGQANDSALNTGTPFTKQLPSYYSFQYNGTVSGPLSKTASFFFSVEQRNIKDDAVYSLAEAPVLDTSVTPNQYEVEPLSGSLYSPSNHLEVSPRLDLQLGQKNTLTMRYQFFRNNVSGGIGSTSLPSTSNTTDSIEHTIQLDDSQIINDHMVNETRFQYRRANTTETPVYTTPSITVPGSFSGGGNSAQFSTSHSDHFELQNYTTIAAGAHAIKFGAWLRDNREALSTNDNFNGTFTFPSVTALVYTLNNNDANCPQDLKGGCEPTNLTYTTGPLGFEGNVFDGALYFQDDWKVRSNLTLSGGLRWETQNHTADHNDWAPRVAFAYSPRKQNSGSGSSKTVLRGGFGFFYDRFAIADLMNLEQFNGGAHSQQRVSITNPNCFNATSLSNITPLSSCGTGTAATPEIYQISSGYHAPYAEQFGGSVERQLTKISTLTVTYLHSLGVHQLVVRDSNAYLPGTFQYGSSTLTGTRPDPSLGIVQQYFPEAAFKQNQVIVNINARFSPRLSVMGFYNWTDANSNGGGGSNPSNSYNLDQDYGRASFVHPQMLFLMGNYTGPWAITFNPFLVVQSGRPYSFTTPYDLSGDAFFNNRPAYESALSNPNNVVDTQYGNFDTIPPQTGETLVPSDLGNSPAGIAVNLRVSRSVGIGPKTAASTGPAQGGGPGGGGPGGGGPPPGGGPGGGGPGGGGGGRGGFGGGLGGGGGRGGGNANTGHKYSLNFSAQALNLFNDVNLGTPVGNVSSGAAFGHPSGLAGGIFSSPSRSASRRIYFQAAFQF
jgi:hypothetical protein